MKATSLLTGTGLVGVPKQIVAWYYMKFLHIWRGINFSRQSLSSSQSSQPLSYSQQITFAMRNRFWLLSKNHLTPALVLHRQY